MDIRPITNSFSVAPQLQPSDLSLLAEQGVKTIICNRPDMENPPELQAPQMQIAAEAAGLEFVFNPVTGSAMTMNNVEEQSDAIAGSDGPIVAYCASGTRSAVMWAFAMAGEMATADIVASISAAGYQLDHMAGQIDAIAQARD